MKYPEQKYSQTEKTDEKLPELTKEQIEHVMAKVDDITKKGTTHSKVAGVQHMNQPKDLPEVWGKMTKNLREIFTRGLIGRARNESTKQREKLSKDISEAYVKNLETPGVQGPVVYANIIGRSATMAGDKDSIIGSFYHSFDDLNIAFIIDKDKYTETEPNYRPTDKKLVKDQWTYWADDPEIPKHFNEIKTTNPDVKLGDELLQNVGKNLVWTAGFDERGMPRPAQEFGFTFYPRVPLRFLKGMVINSRVDISEANTKEIIDVMLRTLKDRPELLMPVYDGDGNLLWPKKMTHGEIVKSSREE